MATRPAGQGRNHTHYDQKLTRELSENHRTIYIFDAEELLKEANYRRKQLGFTLRGDYPLGLDNASAPVVAMDLHTASQ